MGNVYALACFPWAPISVSGRADFGDPFRLPLRVGDPVDEGDHRTAGAEFGDPLRLPLLGIVHAEKAGSGVASGWPRLLPRPTAHFV